MVKKFTFNFEDTTNILKILDNKFNIKWAEDEEKAEAFLKKVSIGTFKIESDNEKEETTISVTNDILIGEFETISKLIKEVVLEAKDIPKTIFAGNTDIPVLREKLKGHYSKNTLSLIEKEFKDVGIENIRFNSNIKKEDLLYEKPTLIIGTFNSDVYPESFNCEGLINTLKDFVKGDNNEIQSKVSIVMSRLKPLETEKSTDIKIANSYIGRYYNERNVVYLNFNPFAVDKMNVLSTELGDFLKLVIPALKSAEIKKENEKLFAQKVFTSEFGASIKKEIVEKEGNIRRFDNDITSYEKLIVERFSQRQADEVILRSLKDFSSKGYDKVAEEIEKSKLLPFLEDVKLGVNYIHFFFRETCLKVPKAVIGGKNWGQRTIYVGKMNIKVKPDNFEIYCDSPTVCNHSHPHSSGSPGSPCFGDGAGRAKIMELKATLQFEELAKMLWFWIKTFLDGSAYMSVEQYIHDRLQQGYPVWNGKGERVVLNDAASLKEGSLSKRDQGKNYKENIKRFETFKIC